MLLSKDQCKMIELICEDKEIELKTDYSGRGMFGEECFGIVGDAKTLAMFFIELTSYLLEDGDDAQLAYELSTNLKTDNIGNDCIYYFPNRQWNDKETDEEE